MRRQTLRVPRLKVLIKDEGVVGFGQVLAGNRSKCRLAQRARHVNVPTPHSRDAVFDLSPLRASCDASVNTSVRMRRCYQQRTPVLNHQEIPHVAWQRFPWRG